MIEIRKKEDWRNVSEGDRQNYLEHAFNINHPVFVSILDDISVLRNRCRSTNTGDALLVLAGSGAGKSHLAKKLLKESPRNDDGESSRIPIVLYNVPQKPSASTMTEELLKAMGDPLYDSGKTARKRERLIKLVTAAKTEIIIIDNVQDIPRQRREKGVEDVASWIRDLIDAVPCLILLLGTPTAKAILKSNKQMQSRTLKTREMRYFDIDTPAQRSLWFSLMNEIDEAFPLAEKTCLSEQAMAHKLLNSTYGVFRPIKFLLKELLHVALSQAKETATEKDLADAYLRVHGKHMEMTNVFREGVQNRLLNGKNEPFEDFHDAGNASFEADVKPRK